MKQCLALMGFFPLIVYYRYLSCPGFRTSRISLIMVSILEIYLPFPSKTGARSPLQRLSPALLIALEESNLVTR